MVLLNISWLQLNFTFLLPYSVPGLLEYEAIPGISNSRPIGSKRCGSHDSLVTTETVTKELTSVLGVLEKNYVDPHTVGQIMKQVCVGWGRGSSVGNRNTSCTVILLYSIL